MLRACIRAGGVLSGEHGIGIEKIREMKEQFDEPTLGIMERVRDAIDEDGLMNPGKIMPDQENVFPVGFRRRSRPDGRGDDEINPVALKLESFVQSLEADSGRFRLVVG